MERQVYTVQKYADGPDEHKARFVANSYSEK